MSEVLCDSSAWLPLVVSGHGHHPVVQSWFDGIDEPASVIFCRATQQSFLRLLTTAAVQARYGDPPLSNNAAWAAYEALVADERIIFQPNEPPGLERWWREYSSRATSSPKVWMDAYLAAFARAEGCQLVTTDGAFRQFQGLDLLVLGEPSAETRRR